MDICEKLQPKRFPRRLRSTDSQGGAAFIPAILARAAFPAITDRTILAMLGCERHSGSTARGRATRNGGEVPWTPRRLNGPRRRSSTPPAACAPRSTAKSTIFPGCAGGRSTRTPTRLAVTAGPRPRGQGIRAEAAGHSPRRRDRPPSARRLRTGAHTRQVGDLALVAADRRGA